MCWDIVKNQSDIQSWLQPLPWQTYLSLCTGSVLTTSDTFKSPRHTNCQLKWTSQGILKKWSSSGRNEPRLFASLLGKYLSCHELKLFISCPSTLRPAELWIMNYYTDLIYLENFKRLQRNDFWCLDMTDRGAVMSLIFTPVTQSVNQECLRVQTDLPSQSQRTHQLTVWFSYFSSPIISYIWDDL